MSTAVVLLPAVAAPYSSPSLPSSKKPSRRKQSKSRPSPLPAADQKSPHLDSPIMATKHVRNNARKSDSRDLVMEEVRILKRGEAVKQLSPTLSSSGDGMESLTPCLTERLGPDPKALPKPSVSGLSAYAGPAFISSPSPSSLPVPFFLKKVASRGEDVATRSILCLLRLDASL